MPDMKMTDHLAGHEIAGNEIVRHDKYRDRAWTRWKTKRSSREMNQAIWV